MSVLESALFDSCVTSVLHDGTLARVALLHCSWKAEVMWDSAPPFLVTSQQILSFTLCSKWPTEQGLSWSQRLRIMRLSMTQCQV